MQVINCILRFVLIKSKLNSRYGKGRIYISHLKDRLTFRRISELSHMDLNLMLMKKPIILQWQVGDKPGTSTNWTCQIFSMVTQCELNPYHAVKTALSHFQSSIFWRNVHNKIKIYIFLNKYFWCYKWGYNCIFMEKPVARKHS